MDVEVNESLYFDHAASTVPCQEALTAFVSAHQQYFASPSAAHQQGRAAQDFLQQLKTEFLQYLGCSDGQLVLSATASEANNMVIHSAMQSGGRIAIAADVHASIYYAQERYADRCDIIPLSDEGSIDPAAVVACIHEDTKLVCFSHVCHETGAMHDVAALAALCERQAVACLIDGVQAVGKHAVNIDEIAATYYTFSAHKFAGVRGCAGIIWRAGVDSGTALIHGGKQEYALRAGTENIAAMAAGCAALRSALAQVDDNVQAVSALREQCIAALSHLNLRIHQTPKHSPYILSFSMPEINGATLVEDLSLSGIAIANGSACAAHEVAPSRIILAMGCSEFEALGTLRISFAPSLNKESVNTLVEHLLAAYERHQL